jgi:hypothetical protein
VSAVAVTGALLVILGIVHMARAALARGRLSEPGHATGEEDTLEPARRGVGFLGLGVLWPGLALVLIGGAMLLSPLIF